MRPHSLTRCRDEAECLSFCLKLGCHDSVLHFVCVGVVSRESMGLHHFPRHLPDVLSLWDMQLVSKSVAKGGLPARGRSQNEYRVEATKSASVCQREGSRLRGPATCLLARDDLNSRSFGGAGSTDITSTRFVRHCHPCACRVHDFILMSIALTAFLAQGCCGSSESWSLMLLASRRFSPSTPNFVKRESHQHLRL